MSMLEQPLSISAATTSAKAAALWWRLHISHDVSAELLDRFEESLEAEIVSALAFFAYMPGVPIFLGSKRRRPEGYLLNCAQALSLSTAAEFWPGELMAVSDEQVTIGSFYHAEGTKIWPSGG
jgi:hypothetical protein